MATDVAGRRIWKILNAKPRVHRAPAEIHILEPDRIEALVETAETQPDASSKHQKCACRLLYQALLIEVAVQITIAPIDRIRRP